MFDIEHGAVVSRIEYAVNGYRLAGNVPLISRRNFNCRVTFQRPLPPAGASAACRARSSAIDRDQ